MENIRNFNVGQMRQYWGNKYVLNWHKFGRWDFWQLNAKAIKDVMHLILLELWEFPSGIFHKLAHITNVSVKHRFHLRLCEGYISPFQTWNTCVWLWLWLWLWWSFVYCQKLLNAECLHRTGYCVRSLINHDWTLGWAFR